MKITWQEDGVFMLAVEERSSRNVGRILRHESGLYWPEVYVGAGQNFSRLAPFMDIRSAKRWLVRWYERLREWV